MVHPSSIPCPLLLSAAERRRRLEDEVRFILA
jgi:hypothetical protein